MISWRHWRTRLILIFAVLGPGFITANVDNDAGGILTYSQAGAQFGYTLLWTMIPITFVIMLLLVAVNFTNVVTEFSGIAGSMQLFHLSKYVSVPVSALIVWAL